MKQNSAGTQIGKVLGFTLGTWKKLQFQRKLQLFLLTRYVVFIRINTQKGNDIQKYILNMYILYTEFCAKSIGKQDKKSVIFKKNL